MKPYSLGEKHIQIMNQQQSGSQNENDDKFKLGYFGEFLKRVIFKDFGGAGSKHRIRAQLLGCEPGQKAVTRIQRDLH